MASEHGYGRAPKNPDRPLLQQADSLFYEDDKRERYSQVELDLMWEKPAVIVPSVWRVRCRHIRCAVDVRQISLASQTLARIQSVVISLVFVCRMWLR